MRKVAKFGVALLAVTALSALIAGTASAAKAKTLDLTWELAVHQLAAGETFDLVLGEAGATINTDGGTVSCAGGFGRPGFSGIQAVDLTNNEATDQVETGEGAGSLFGGAEACTNNTGLGSTVEEYVYAETSILRLEGSKGKAILKARAATMPIYFETYYSGGDACIYTTTSLKGTLKLEPWDEELKQLNVVFSNQKMKLDKPYSAKECASKGVTLSAEFEFASRGEDGFGEGDYIFGRLL